MDQRRDRGRGLRARRSKRYPRVARAAKTSEPRRDVPAAPDRRARLRHRAGDARRLQPPLPPVPRGQRRGQARASRRPTGTASSARSASASSSTTSASTRRPSGCSSEFEAARAADGRLAAGQAALHRPADRPPPARAGRDLLQLGDDQDPAPQLLPQRLHLRAPGGLAPSTSRTTSRPRCRPTAPTTRRATTLRDDAGCASSTTSSCSASSRTWSATSTTCCGACASRARRLSRCAPTSRSRCCRRCSSATRAPTWSARSSTASPRCRSRCRSCTTTHGKLVDRRRAVRRGRPADRCSASRAPTSWSTWRCRRPTCSSCAR